MPEVIHRLVNPYREQSSVVRVQADMGTDDYNYLFRGVLAGQRGTQAPLINQFLKKVADECRRLNLPSHFDATHESIVAEFISRCTFGRVDRDATPRNAARRSKKVHGAHSDVESQPADTKGKAGRGKRQDRKETTKEGQGGLGD